MCKTSTSKLITGFFLNPPSDKKLINPLHNTHPLLWTRVAPTPLRFVPQTLKKNIKNNNSFTSILIIFRLKNCVRKLYFMLKTPKTVQVLSQGILLASVEFSQVPHQKFTENLAHGGTVYQLTSILTGNQFEKSGKVFRFRQFM